MSEGRPATDHERTRAYWESNIGRFGMFYSDISREELLGPRWLRATYRGTVMRLERRLMMDRYKDALSFMDGHVRAGMTVADIGCGTGVLTVELLRRGARVVALDYALTALDLTRRLVEECAPERAGDVQYVHADVTETVVPQSDAAIALGVTPYVADIARMYANVLPVTSTFYCLVTDARHWANRLRCAVPMLNVRRLRFHTRETVDALLARHGFRLVSRRTLGTGFLDVAVHATGPRT